MFGHNRLLDAVSLALKVLEKQYGKSVTLILIGSLFVFASSTVAWVIGIDVGGWTILGISALTTMMAIWERHKNANQWKEKKQWS